MPKRDALDLGPAAKDFASLSILARRYAEGRQEYDFVMLVLISHARDYATDPDRLRRYAATTVSARIMQFLSACFMKMQLFLEGYLDAVRTQNPFVVIMCARTALEAYATVYDALGVVSREAGLEPTGFAERVRRADEALINATWGHPTCRRKERPGRAPAKSAQADHAGRPVDSRCTTYSQPPRSVGEALSVRRSAGRLRPALRVLAPKCWAESVPRRSLTERNAISPRRRSVGRCLVARCADQGSPDGAISSWHSRRIPDIGCAFRPRAILPDLISTRRQWVAARRGALVADGGGTIDHWTQG